jgi:hypothetical protein
MPPWGLAVFGDKCEVVERLGSNSPCECECFRFPPLGDSNDVLADGVNGVGVSGDVFRTGRSPVRTCVTVGLEKFCKLELLEFGCAVLYGIRGCCASAF